MDQRAELHLSGESDGSYGMRTFHFQAALMCRPCGIPICVFISKRRCNLKRICDSLALVWSIQGRDVSGIPPDSSSNDGEFGLGALAILTPLSGF